MKEKKPTQASLLNDLFQIIEAGQQKVSIQVNATLVQVYWQVGQRIKHHILDNERAEYGKKVMENIASQLTIKFGNSFRIRNLRRMIQFTELFPQIEIVSTLSTQLTWSHFILLFSIKNEEARQFYSMRIMEEKWSVRQTKDQIERKVFERSILANTQLTQKDTLREKVFKDPYFLDFLGLKEGYLEDDLESAILRDLESFILELGMGFTFVERQKRMIIDGEDFYLDLLFYHRKLRRLVAIELKIGRFKAAYKGQMELYLKWLDKYDKQKGENMPIGLILCAEASREQIELLEMHKDGIMVAEYWTELPPKEELEKKLHQSLLEAKERMARKRLQ